MKSCDFEAVTYKGEVYCIECLPEDVLPTDPECFPIFGNAEWDYAPSCTVCGAVHDYVTIVNMEDNQSSPDPVRAGPRRPAETDNPQTK